MLVLTKALPVESALIRALTGGVVWGWDQEMMATAVELQHATIRVLIAAHGGKRAKIPKPMEVPRPMREMLSKSQKRSATVEEVFSSIGDMLGR